MNHVSVFTMQEFWNPKKIDSIITKEIEFARNPLAIACTCAGKLIVIDDSFCSFWNYQEEQCLQIVGTWLNACAISVNKIYAHPRKDIAIIPKDQGNKHVLYNHEDNSSIDLDCFKSIRSNVLYSDISGFYAIKNKFLIYNALIWQERCRLKNFSPGLIFSILDEEEYCFLCCDDKEESVYMLYTEPKNSSVKKIFNFCTELDLNNWVYNPVEKTLYAITQDNRQLYAAHIEKQEQRILPKINDFEIGNLILANDKILVLLSEQCNKICYIDVKNMHPLIITTHAVSEKNKPNTAQGQKIAVFPDSKEIIIALDHKCLGIAIPSWIDYFDVYEKYREGIGQLPIPEELGWLITIKLVRSIINDKKDAKKYHEIE